MPLSMFTRMTPSSIASTGTGNSSSINSDGSVTFSSCDGLSLNGVFTSSYDNYMVAVRISESTTANGVIALRFRVSGADNTTASSYVDQSLSAGHTTITALRETKDYGWAFGVSSTQPNGATLYVFGPHLAQPTAWRSVSAVGESNARIYDFAGTHNQSTSYTGLTLLRSGFFYSGLVTVFGFNQ